MLSLDNFALEERSSFLKEAEREMIYLSSLENFISQSKALLTYKEIDHSLYLTYHSALESFKRSPYYEKDPNYPSRESIFSLEELGHYRTIINLSLEEEEEKWYHKVYKLMVKVGKFIYDTGKVWIEKGKEFLFGRALDELRDKIKSLRTSLMNSPKHIKPFDDKVLKTSKYVPYFNPGGGKDVNMLENALNLYKLTQAIDFSVLGNYFEDCEKAAKDLSSKMKTEETAASYKAVQAVLKSHPIFTEASPTGGSTTSQATKMSNMLRHIIDNNFLPYTYNLTSKNKEEVDRAKLIQSFDSEQSEKGEMSSFLPKSSLLYASTSQLKYKGEEDGPSYYLTTFRFKTNIQTDQSEKRKEIKFDPSLKSTQEVVSFLEHLEKSAESLDQNQGKIIEIVEKAGKMALDFPNLVESLNNAAKRTEQKVKAIKQSKAYKDKNNLPKEVDPETESKERGDVSILRSASKIIQRLQKEIGKIQLLIEAICKYIHVVINELLSLLNKQLGKKEEKEGNKSPLED